MERFCNSEEDRAASLLIVQELADKCDDKHQIPNNFIYKLDDYPQPVDYSVPYMEDVFIDLNLLSSNSSEEFDKLRSALVFNGCFQLINHGMSTSYLDEMRQLSKQFFALPMEEKMKCAREKGGIEGYGDEQLVVDNQMLDWNDALSLRIYPENERTLKYWPENPCNFKKMLHDYGERMKTLCEVLVKTMARLLGVEENVFLNRYGEKVEMNVRFNFYPLCPIPERVLGLKPHADFSTMTIILQDKEVEGLQVMKDGQWFKVPVFPCALFVNLGDAMEVMSNGIFKSTVHRVVTSSEKERISVATFWDNDRNKQIGPLKELITDDHPQMYKSISVEDYFKIFLGDYAIGQRPIETLRIASFLMELASVKFTTASLVIGGVEKRTKRLHGSLAPPRRGWFELPTDGLIEYGPFQEGPRGYPQPIDSLVPYMNDVFIDLDLLSASSDESDKLRSALLINHGMSASFLDEMHQLSKEFFALPMEEKINCAREKGGIEGYGDEQSAVNGHTLDWNDGLSLRMYPEHERTPKYWLEFQMLHDYGERLKIVCEVLVKTMARLGVEENVFLNRYGEKVEMNVRFNFYPLCPIPERVVGLKPHADFSTMAIILQDKEVEGLQVMKDGQWFKVLVIPSALFVNLGDAMEVTSNQIFKSTFHRVVTSSEKERISVAMFWDNDRNKQIGPLKELITDDRPQMYRSMSVEDYSKTYFGSYAMGQRPIETLRF
ncbi:hypothetical protein V2J09_006727 [Rumex salicifolius]